VGKDDSFVKELPPDPTPEQVVDRLEQAFVDHVGDEAYLAGMKVVVPGVGRLYGVKVPVLRKIAQGVMRAYKANQDLLRKVALLCWDQDSREHKVVALFILEKLRLEPSERWELGEQFLPDVNNWEMCDQLCMALLGQTLAESPRYMDVLGSWVEDENFWVRRAALVAPVYLRRAKYVEDVALDLDRRTLRICKALMNDPEK
jgi:3-methyladenine DNA glycosylase AlkD